MNFHFILNKDCTSFPFYLLIAKCFLLVNGEPDVVVEEGEDEEELYELTSLPNGETSDISSEAEGGQDEEQSEMSDSDEKDAASCLSAATLDFHRALIEDIRFVFIISSFTIICIIKYHDIWCQFGLHKSIL